MKYFKDQKSIYFEENWVAPDEINKKMNARKPIIIKEGNYPLIYKDGIYYLIVR